MGTDELFLIAKEDKRLDRAKLKGLIVDHWTERGATLVGAKWTSAAVWDDDDQDRFAYAMSPTTSRGWITVVESADYSTSVDAELGRRLAALTTLWASWSFDHSCIYGQKRLSKKPSKEPVDLGGCAYKRLRDREGWEFEGGEACHARPSRRCEIGSSRRSPFRLRR